MAELYGGGVIPPELRNKAQKAIDKYDKVRQQALDNIKQFKNEPNRIQLIKNKIKELDLNKKKILAILATTGLITVGVITTLSILVPALLAGIVALSSVAGIGVVVISKEHRQHKDKAAAIDYIKTLNWFDSLMFDTPKFREDYNSVLTTQINKYLGEIDRVYNLENVTKHWKKMYIFTCWDQISKKLGGPTPRHPKELCDGTFNGSHIG